MNIPSELYPYLDYIKGNPDFFWTLFVSLIVAPVFLLYKKYTLTKINRFKYPDFLVQENNFVRLSNFPIGKDGHFRRLKLEKNFLDKVFTNEDISCIWIYGAGGVGKSHLCYKLLDENSKKSVGSWKKSKFDRFVYDWGFLNLDLINNNLIDKLKNWIPKRNIVIVIDDVTRNKEMVYDIIKIINHKNNNNNMSKIRIIFCERFVDEFLYSFIKNKKDCLEVKEFSSNELEVLAKTHILNHFPFHEYPEINAWLARVTQGRAFFIGLALNSLYHSGWAKVSLMTEIDLLNEDYNRLLSRLSLSGVSPEQQEWLIIATLSKGANWSWKNQLNLPEGNPEKFYAALGEYGSFRQGPESIKPDISAGYFLIKHNVSSNNLKKYIKFSWETKPYEVSDTLQRLFMDFFKDEDGFLKITTETILGRNLLLYPESLLVFVERPDIKPIKQWIDFIINAISRSSIVSPLFLQNMIREESYEKNSQIYSDVLEEIIKSLQKFNIFEDSIADEFWKIFEVDYGKSVGAIENSSSYINKVIKLILDEKNTNQRLSNARTDGYDEQIFDFSRNIWNSYKDLLNESDAQKIYKKCALSLVSKNLYIIGESSRNIDNIESGIFWCSIGLYKKIFLNDNEYYSEININRTLFLIGLATLYHTVDKQEPFSSGYQPLEKNTQEIIFVLDELEDNLSLLEYWCNENKECEFCNQILASFYASILYILGYILYYKIQDPNIAYSRLRKLDYIINKIKDVDQEWPNNFSIKSAWIYINTRVLGNTSDALYHQVMDRNSIFILADTHYFACRNEIEKIAERYADIFYFQRRWAFFLSGITYSAGEALHFNVANKEKAFKVLMESYYKNKEIMLDILDKYPDQIEIRRSVVTFLALSLSGSANAVYHQLLDKNGIFDFFMKVCKDKELISSISKNYIDDAFIQGKLSVFLSNISFGANKALLYNIQTSKALDTLINEYKQNSNVIWHIFKNHSAINHIAQTIATFLWSSYSSFELAEKANKLKQDVMTSIIIENYERDRERFMELLDKWPNDDFINKKWTDFLYSSTFLAGELLKKQANNVSKNKSFDTFNRVVKNNLNSIEVLCSVFPYEQFFSERRKDIISYETQVRSLFVIIPND